MADKNRRGRCKPCGAVYVWPSRAMRLKDAHCPNCGRPLGQTAFMRGVGPKGARIVEIETPDTEAIAIARFGHTLARGWR